jgi:4-aminobutyrate aminotransferase/(S)-3-amino-2-methylpropionate transaminase
MLEQVVKEIKAEQLLERVEASGATIMSGLEELQQRYPALLSRARGRGTFCAVDLPDTGARDALLTRLRARGVHLGGCGDASVRIRPSLTFTPSHANIMLDGLNDVLGEL